MRRVQCRSLLAVSLGLRDKRQRAQRRRNQNQPVADALCLHSLRRYRHRERLGFRSHRHGNAVRRRPDRRDNRWPTVRHRPVRASDDCYKPETSPRPKS